MLLRDRGAFAAGLLILAAVAACWVPTYLAGGAAVIPPLWFFLPILFAGVRFGVLGALVTALASTAAAGPLTPDQVSHHVAQVQSDWVTRGGFFVVVGLAMAAVTRRLQQETAENQATREMSERAAIELDARRALDAAKEESQREFNQTLQVARTEEEAYEIVRRHVERSVANSTVVVLNRNNSDNRLEAAGSHDRALDLDVDLADATPDSCLAIRFGHAHARDAEHEPLLACDVCGCLPGLSTCVPSLVGGQVIGSVLVRHGEPLDEDAARRVGECVNQSAPVLANLRTLVVAETRAATDALTGLPNRRAVDDTLKRLAAQAGRTMAPLAMVLLDLDHFKKINDRHGHGRGDDVLAAVGDLLRVHTREADFAGRYGGEEFVLLLPDTDSQGAALVAEKIRLALRDIALRGIENTITGSFGIAVMPTNATDTETLIRHADRSLYKAKEQGRDRYEIASAPGTVVSTGNPGRAHDTLEPALASDATTV